MPIITNPPLRNIVVNPRTGGFQHPWPRWLNSLVQSVTRGEIKEISDAGALSDRTIFIANRAYELIAARESHATAASDSGTLQVTKETSTEAPGAGVNMLGTAFDLTAAPNTVQEATMTSTTSRLLLEAGDRLSLNYVGALTALAGVTVTLSLRARK